MLHLQCWPPLMVVKKPARPARWQPATRRKLGAAITAIVHHGTKGAKRMASPFYTAEHEAYREVVRRFVEKEIEPYAHEWDEAGGFPRELYQKAAAIGLLGLGFPEEYGGTAVDKLMWIVAGLEIVRGRAPGGRRP